MKRERIRPNKTAYLIHTDWMELSLSLPEDISRLFDNAIKLYCLYGEMPSDERIKPLFSLVKMTIDKETNEYEEKRKEISRKRSEAGKLGGGQIGNQNARKYPLETNKNQQNQQNQPVSVPVSDYIDNILGVSTPNDFSNLIDWINNNEELDYMADRNNFKTYLTAQNLSKLQQSYTIEEIKRGILDLENRKDFQEKGFITFYQMLKTYLDGNSQYW